MSAPVNATFTGTERELRRAFLDDLTAAGQGERNVAAHSLGVDRFAEYLAPRDLAAARPEDLEGFLSYLTELGVSSSSLRTYRTVVGRWLDFLREHRGGSPSEAPAAASAAAPADAPAAASAAPFGGEFLSAEPVPDEDGNFPTVILDRTPTPQPAAFPAFEPEPTTPMMKAVADPSDPSDPSDAFGSSDAFGASDAFGDLGAPDPSGLESASDVGAADFEPVEPARPAAALVADEPDEEPAFEPVEARRAPAFEPADGDDDAEPSGFEPVAASTPETEADADFEAPGSESDAGPGELDAEFPFASAPPAPAEPDAAFGAPHAMADARDAGDAGDAAPGTTPGHAAAQGNAGASVFGDLPPALDEAEGFEAPELGEPASEAEQRDRAKLAAPPLPSVEAAPAPSVPGETEFEGPSASIPLAGGGAAALDETGSKNERTQRGAVPHSAPGGAALDPTNGAMATQPGNGKWGLRRPAGERLDLSLDAIMTLAVSGELAADHLVRKPSGEWVSASELRPLRRALGLDGGPSTMVRRARAERTLGRAAAGAVVAGLFSGLLWWVTALVVGAELVPLAILGGLLGGFGARMAGQGAGIKIGALGAGAAPLSVLVGRYLVYETLSSGIALEGFQEIGGLGSFLGSGLGTTQAICLGLGALAGLLVGSIGSR